MSLELRPKKEMLRKFFQMLHKHGFKLLKYLVLIKVAITCIFGTAFYLYKIHKDKESYALNILLTAFVTRITGVEFLQAIMHRLSRMKFHLLRVLYRNEFINLISEDDTQSLNEEE